MKSWLRNSVWDRGCGSLVVDDLEKVRSPLADGAGRAIVGELLLNEVAMRRLLLIPTLFLIPSLRAQAPAKSLNELKAFFSANCVKCHGPDGSAHTLEGKQLGGRDFTDVAWRDKEKDEAMAKDIRKGILFGIVMPSFKDQLTEEDMQLLVKEVLRKAEKGKVIAP